MGKHASKVTARFHAVARRVARTLDKGPVGQLTGSLEARLFDHRRPVPLALLSLAFVAVLIGIVVETLPQIGVGVRLLIPYSIATWKTSYTWLAPIVAVVLALRLPRITQRRGSVSIGTSILIFGLEAATMALVLPAGIEYVRRDELFSPSLTGASLPEVVALLSVPVAALGVLALLVGYLLVLSNRRRVFVSFHHSHEALAEELAEALSKYGLVVRRIPFDPAHDHDRLLSSVLTEVRRCDAVVCLPGPRASFVENEILAASTLRKFIVFVVGDEVARLPNTALYGYPVFRLNRIRRRKFAPLSDLLLLGMGSLRATWRHLNSVGTLPAFFPSVKVGLFAVASALVVPYLAGGFTALWLGGRAEALTLMTTLHRNFLSWESLREGGLGGFIFVSLMLIGTALLLVNQLRSRRVLRQQILTGRATRATMASLLGASRMGRQILACLWKEPPLADHELSPSSATRTTAHSQPGA